MGGMSAADPLATAGGSEGGKTEPGGKKDVPPKRGAEPKTGGVVTGGDTEVGANGGIDAKMDPPSQPWR